MTHTSPERRPTSVIAAPEPAGADSGRPGDPDSVSVVALLNVVLSHRYLIGGVTLLCYVLVVGTLLLWPRSYTTESSFMLESRPSLPANLSGLASQFGFALPMGDAGQSPAFYADLLRSREILSAVAATRFTISKDGTPGEAELADWLRVRGSDSLLRRDRTIRKLDDCVTVSLAGKTGVITLKVRTRNAALSQQISQRLLALLNEFNLQKRQSQASAERRFTEARLQEAQTELRGAEDRLLQFVQRNRDTRNSPVLSLEQDRLSRDVAMRQQVYTSVLQAYDRAKIEEVRDTPVITVLQQPEAVVRPDSRGLVVMSVLTVCLGLLLGGCLVVVLEAFSPQAGRRPPELADLAVLRGEVWADIRHPLRTLGRIARLGAG